jgi:ATP/maltotriose-dependent transcriptional regulator MalT
MPAGEALDRAREAFAEMAWADAYALFCAADEQEQLSVEDLDRAARAAVLIGQDSDADELWRRAVQEAERIGDYERGAACAGWLGMALMNRGEIARASGWFSRAGRLHDEAGVESAIAGYLLLPIALQSLFGGDPASARPVFAEALQIGERFREADLLALSRLGLGRSLLGLGHSRDGMAMLDDAMVSVTAGEVSPYVAGIIYCAVIEACHSVLDVRRAREWTEGLAHWCELQPSLVRYRGQCLVHRAEIMKLRGLWPEALAELDSARPRSYEAQAVMGAAAYERAELNRLQGEFADADAAYRQASEHGHEPQPGLALLRLAQGQPDAAVATIRRVVDEQRDPAERSRLLAAYVEIMLTVDDVAAARTAAEELAGLARDLGARFLDATADYAAGTVALADGDPSTAIAALRRAWTTWCDIDAPYEAARARLAIGLACRDMSDDDTAAMELAVARKAFDELGAVADVARLDALTRPGTTTGAAGGLTGRELEVLELVAAGKTNRQIATDLVISEKTVARHLSNIFTKLGVSSRAAATAYAFRHGLA